MGLPAARWYAGAGAAAVVLHSTRLLGDLGSALLYDAVGLSAAVAVVVGRRRHRPRVPAPWGLLGLGQLMFVLGDAYTVFSDHVLHSAPPVPSLTDVLWLPAYPVLMASMVLLRRAQRRGDDRVGLVDSSILSASLAVLVWTYVVAPTLSDALLPWPGRVLGAIYPALDLLLLAATFRLAVRRGRASPAQRLLVCSMLTLFAGDLVFAQHVLTGGLIDRLVYPLWLAAYVCAGAAALHPSMAAAEQAPSPRAAATPDWLRLWLLAGCCLTAPAVLVVEWAHGRSDQVPVLVGGACVLFLLVVARVSLMTDAARQLAGTLATERGERRFAALVRSASDVILVVDAEGRVRAETPSVQAVLGWHPDELRGRPLTTLFEPADAAALLLPSSSPSAPRELLLRARDGAWTAVDVLSQDLRDDPDVHGLVLTVRDVSERRALELRLHHQATHDALTGLPNRRLFLERLDVALAAGPVRCLAVLYLDVDGFKAVNDALGHANGDRLLVEVAARLRRTVRPLDLLCRLGGDEFVALLTGADGAEAGRIAERLRTALAPPFDLDGHTVRVGGSTGVALVPDGAGGTAHDVLAAADTAMYASKRAGRDRWTLFEDGMHDELLRASAVEAALRRAVAAGGLDVAYQPVVEFATGEVVGFEALARWTDPELGVLAPAELIPVAEDTGLVVPLGQGVLERACRFIASCNEGRPSPLRVAVNVSVRQLEEPGLVGAVRSVLAATALAPGLLTLEITESIRLFDGSTEVLRRLKDLGVRLSLDDFGTGYAALTHVTSLPIDEIKIDRSFVSVLEDGGRPAQLVASVVALGHELALEVVAEGIETEGQAARLVALGCDLAQGRLYGHPLPPDEARALVGPAVALPQAREPAASLAAQTS